MEKFVNDYGSGILEAKRIGNKAAGLKMLTPKQLHK